MARLLLVVMAIGLTGRAGWSSFAEGQETGTASAKAVKKRPAPSPDAQEQALTAARAVHHEQYDKAKTSAEKLRLAGDLALAADQPADENSAERYVLKKLAAELAAQAGDPVAAFRYAEQLGSVYQIDLLAFKLDLLGRTDKAAASKPQWIAVATQAKLLLDQAVAADRYDEANQAGDLAIAAARAAKDKDATLVKQLVAAKKDIEPTSTAFAAVKAAVTLLESQPLDPQANAQYGRFLCFIKGDWDLGITMLALGDDQPLKAPAVRELQAAGDSSAQVATADAWWDLAENQPDAIKKRVRQHAALWYRQARPGLAEAEKQRVAQRLREAEPADAAAPTAAVAKAPSSASKHDKESEVLAAAAQARAKARAAKKPVNLVLTNEAAVRRAWKLPTQESEWRITPAGLQLKGSNATSIESLFTITGDCEIALTVSAHCTDPPTIQLFGEQIAPPRPRTVSSYERPYGWSVVIVRRGPLLTATVGPQRIGTFTIKESQQNAPTKLGINYTRSEFGMLLIAVSVRAAEFNPGP